MIYIPYVDFRKNCECLRVNELEEQIEDMYFLYKNINKVQLNMWKYYEKSLMKYLALSLMYWNRLRNQSQKAKKVFPIYIEDILDEEYSDLIPHWIDNHMYEKHLMLSHRVILLRMDYNHYKQFFPKLSSKDLSLYPKKVFEMDKPDSYVYNQQWIAKRK